MTIVHPYKPGKHTFSFAGPSRYCALVVGILFTSLDSISSMMAYVLHISFMKRNMFPYRPELSLSDSVSLIKARDAPDEDSCVGGEWPGVIFAVSVVTMVYEKFSAGHYPSVCRYSCTTSRKSVDLGW